MCTIWGADSAPQKCSSLCGESKPDSSTFDGHGLRSDEIKTPWSILIAMQNYLIDTGNVLFLISRVVSTGIFFFY